MQIIGEPCYDALRTKQQLGYSVHSGVRLTFGVIGFCVVIASGELAAQTQGLGTRDLISASLTNFNGLLCALGPRRLAFTVIRSCNSGGWRAFS